MAFRINRKGTFVMPVEITTPVDDKTVSEKIRLRVKRLNREELNALQKQGDVVVLREVLVGWIDEDMIDDASGTPMPFDEAAREAFLADPAAVRASALQYAKDIHGLREKN